MTCTTFIFYLVSAVSVSRSRASGPQQSPNGGNTQATAASRTHLTSARFPSYPPLSLRRSPYRTVLRLSETCHFVPFLLSVMPRPSRSSRSAPQPAASNSSSSSVPEVAIPSLADLAKLTRPQVRPLAERLNNLTTGSKKVLVARVDTSRPSARPLGPPARLLRFPQYLSSRIYSGKSRICGASWPR